MTGAPSAASPQIDETQTIAVQVRKPVYTTSVERWRRYGDGLQPLVEALDYKPAAAPTKAPRRTKAKAKPATA